MRSVVEILYRIPPRYDSSARAAEDMAEGILSAETTEEIMEVIGAVSAAVDEYDHSLLLATAYALVAKRAGRDTP